MKFGPQQPLVMFRYNGTASSIIWGIVPLTYTFVLAAIVSMFRRTVVSLLVGPMLLGVSGVSIAGERTPGASHRQQGSNREYALKAWPASTIHATLECRITAPNLTAKDWYLFVAKPVDLPSQTAVSISMKPRGKSTVDLSPRQQPLLLGHLPVRRKPDETGITVQVEYRATLLARRLVRRKPGIRYSSISPLGKKEREFDLASGPLFDFDSPKFRRWLERMDLERSKEDGEISYARKVFLLITKNYGYDYHSQMDWRATYLCQTDRSDCGGLAILFVSTLRAGGIPARLLVGRWAKSLEPGKLIGGIEYQQQHVKAEFHARGVGWVPVDLSSAVLYDNSEKGLQYFGNDPGNFLVMHLDSGLVLDTVRFGRKKIPWLQGLAYWVHGDGDLEGVTVQRDWQVE